jgi:hypothetical protein
MVLKNTLDQKTPEPRLRGLVSIGLWRICATQEQALNLLLCKGVTNNASLECSVRWLDRFGLEKTVVPISPSIDHLDLAVVHVEIDEEIMP